MTKIISAFPASGKSFLFNKGELKCVDSDSSLFSWIFTPEGEKIRNPNFIDEYKEHILSLIGTVDYIFVSSHREVRDMLTDSDLRWVSVMPSYKMKNEIVGRCFNRGSTEPFCKMISDNWDSFVPQSHNGLTAKGANAWVTLQPNEYISDHMYFIDTIQGN